MPYRLPELPEANGSISSKARRAADDPRGGRPGGDHEPRRRRQVARGAHPRTGRSGGPRGGRPAGQRQRRRGARGGVARACLAAGLRVKRVELGGLPAKGDVSDWLAAGHPPAELESLVDASPIFETSPPTPPGRPEPELRREGLDLALVWPDGVRFTLTAIRDGRDGVRGELTVTRARPAAVVGRVRRCPAPRPARASARSSRPRRPGVPWGDYLEEAAWRLTQARAGRRAARHPDRRGDVADARAACPRCSTKASRP